MFLLRVVVLSIFILHVFSSRLGFGSRKNSQETKSQKTNNSQSSVSMDDFKTRISNVITNIKQLKSAEGIKLTAQLSNSLFSIYNILEQQHQRSKLGVNTNRNPQNSKKILQIYISKLLKTIQNTQNYIEKQHLKSVTGNNNIEIGDDNLIDGKQNKIKGSNNMVIGDQNLISGNSALLRGNLNSIIGSDTFVMGHNNMAKGSNSIIFSFDNKLHRDNSLVVGEYQVDLSPYRK